MSQQLKVKPSSTPLLPATYTYTRSDGGPGIGVLGRGLVGKEFDARVNEHGDQWVMVNGIVQMGGVSPAGTIVSAHTDVYGNLADALPSLLVPGSYPNVSFSTANESSRIAKTSGGVVLGISGYNSKASAQFILLFDYYSNVTAVPAAGTVSVVGFSVAAASNYSVDFGRFGIPCFSGIVVANSSTNPTLTIGSADCTFTVRFS